MKLKNFSICLFTILSLGATLPASAVRVFSDMHGNKFTTSGQSATVISIDTKGASLTEDMFNHIAAQAKEDGYKHILLNDSTHLDQNAAKNLALNFLTVAWDDYYNAQSVIFSDENLFKDGATVLDIKRFITLKTLIDVYPHPFVNPYLILPVDNLVSSLLIDVYVKRDYLDEQGYDNGKILECREYYRTCDRIRL